MTVINKIFSKKIKKEQGTPALESLKIKLFINNYSVWTSSHRFFIIKASLCYYSIVVLLKNKE